MTPMATRRRAKRNTKAASLAELGAIIEAFAAIEARDARSGARQATDDLIDGRLQMLTEAKAKEFFANVPRHVDLPLWREIPAAGKSFTMGSRDRDRYDDEDPVHVGFAQSWRMAAVPVTLAQYECMVGRHGPHRDIWTSAPEADCPVTHVSWFEARLFARWLDRQRVRLAEVLGALLGDVPAAWRFHLPTEAQWEFSCRGGTTTRFWGGDADADLDNTGWFEGNSGDRIHRVAERAANKWGLFEVHGNVWEWCRDWYEERLRDGTDPIGPSGGPGRVLHGGCYGDSPPWCRSAIRKWLVPDRSGGYAGLRLCLCAPEPKIEDRR